MIWRRALRRSGVALPRFSPAGYNVLISSCWRRLRRSVLRRKRGSSRQSLQIELIGVPDFEWRMIFSELPASRPSDRVRGHAADHARALAFCMSKNCRLGPISSVVPLPCGAHRANPSWRPIPNSGKRESFMSIFGKIVSAIFGHASAAPAAGTARRPVHRRLPRARPRRRARPLRQERLRPPSTSLPSSPSSPPATKRSSTGRNRSST